MYEFEEELVEWDEVLRKAEELPPRLKRILVLRVKGLPPEKIADRLNLETRSVKQYNTELNAVFNLEGLSRTEQDFFYALVVRRVVQHSDKYPRMAEAIEYSSDYIITPGTPAATGPTWKLPKFIGTDPNDSRIIYRFTLFIVLFVIVLIIIVFTLLALLAGMFTPPTTP